MKKGYLLTPGPTPLPPEVIAALGRPIIHHRTAQFRTILKEAIEGLKYVFKTDNEVFIFASSGTGAMEAAVANLLSPGDKALVVKGGKFGERWEEICLAYNVEVIPIDVEWGRAVDPRRIEEILLRHKPQATSHKPNPLKEDLQPVACSLQPVKAVFTTLCETSTGVTYDIKAIGEIVRNSEVALVVDAISGLGVVDLQMDNWSIDVVVAGSQKGLMLPPGLSFISLSAKAWKLVEDSRSPSYYFDLRKAKKAQDKNDTVFTPAISLVIALNESLKLIKQQGLDSVFSRYKRQAKAVREAINAMGLELFALVECASDAITAVKVPKQLDGERLVKTMRDDYGVSIAGGQGKLKGKLFRIAHMGYIQDEDLIVAITCLEKVLAQMGYKFPLGGGVGALEEVLNEKNISQRPFV